MAIFTMVFSRVFGGGRHYPLYLVTPLLGWSPFSVGSTRGLESVVLNGPIIRKVFVPKAIFPVAAVSSQVVNFLFSLVPPDGACAGGGTLIGPRMRTPA
jgi:ABC-type polysaccharide/polyol phosphate export permease